MLTPESRAHSSGKTNGPLISRLYSRAAGGHGRRAAPAARTRSSANETETKTQTRRGRRDRLRTKPKPKHKTRQGCCTKGMYTRLFCWNENEAWNFETSKWPTLQRRRARLDTHCRCVCTGVTAESRRYICWTSPDI